MPDKPPGPVDGTTAAPPDAAATPTRERWQPPGPADLARWEKNYNEGYIKNCHNFWTPEEIKRYREWIAAEAIKFVDDTSFKIDCADWTLVNIVRYARLRHLPIGFRIGALTPLPGIGIGIYMGDSYNQADWQRTYDHYEKSWRKRIGAADLDELSTGNTLEVPTVDELLPGDLLIANNGHHVQLILANNSKIDAPDDTKVVKPRRVLEALQGNLPEAPVERVAWDLDNSNYYGMKKSVWTFKRKDAQRVQDSFPKQNRGRRWNFKFFDTSVPHTPACDGWLRSGVWMD